MGWVRRQVDITLQSNARRDKKQKRLQNSNYDCMHPTSSSTPTVTYSTFWIVWHGLGQQKSGDIHGVVVLTKETHKKAYHTCLDGPWMGRRWAADGPLVLLMPSSPSPAGTMWSSRVVILLLFFPSSASPGPSVLSLVSLVSLKPENDTKTNASKFRTGCT